MKKLIIVFLIGTPLCNYGMMSDGPIIDPKSGNRLKREEAGLQSGNPLENQILNSAIEQGDVAQLAESLKKSRQIVKRDDLLSVIYKKRPRTRPHDIDIKKLVDKAPYALGLFGLSAITYVYKNNDNPSIADQKYITIAGSVMKVAAVYLGICVLLRQPWLSSQLGRSSIPSEKRFIIEFPYLWFTYDKETKKLIDVAKQNSDA